MCTYVRRAGEGTKDAGRARTGDFQQEQTTRSVSLRGRVIREYRPLPDVERKSS